MPDLTEEFNNLFTLVTHDAPITNDVIGYEQLTELRREIYRNHTQDPLRYFTNYTAPVYSGVDMVIARPIPVEPLTEIPDFIVQQNTQDAEIRELRHDYPVEVRLGNYLEPIHRGLASQRDALRSTIRQLRRVAIVREVIAASTPKQRKTLVPFLEGAMTSRQIRDVQSSDFTPLYETRAMRDYREQIAYYARLKREFLRDKIRYAPLQAKYNQKVAMIRQKPRKEICLYGKKILETVSQWENVWGMSVQNAGDILWFRIGLCDIMMSESATESRYDDPQNILLAPFVFTLKIDGAGRFYAPSTDGHASGLSQQQSSGHTNYDFHPHQLSDSPCFGSFGQTFTDMATNGDIVSLIGGIIAFYSQYNSQDSAGVTARLYHPSRLPAPYNLQEYTDFLQSKIRRLNSHCFTIDANKFESALSRYTAYHETERTNSAPQRIYTHHCAHCGENPVDDDNVYYVTSDNDRVCSGCWDDYFCSGCENHYDDCNCN